MSGMPLFTLCENSELKMSFDQSDSLKTMSLLSIATQTAPHWSTLNDPLNRRHAHSMVTNLYEYLHSQSRLRLARFSTLRLPIMTCATPTTHFHPLMFFHICANFDTQRPKHRFMRATFSARSLRDWLVAVLGRAGNTSYVC